ncbi:DUF1344 domain-containing protein [Jiella endophytica]|nr:DUF1344 domain-containing protein [Jiella endophytica]
MRSLTLPLTLAASLIAATSAYAASPSSTMSGDKMTAGSTTSGSAKKLHVATGKIKSIDTAANTLTLTNGKTFMLPADFTTSSVKTGERVQVRYAMNGKQMSATTVKAAK